MTRTTVIVVQWVAGPGQEIEGFCWTFSIAVLSPNAWRCQSDNSILDPCFGSPTDTFVICGGKPFPAGEGVKLNLTEPLPVSEAHKVDRFYGWRLELVDGVQCDYILYPTGTLDGLGLIPMIQAGINYRCSDGWYVAGDLQVGDVWIANKVQWSDDLDQVIASIQAPVRTVWR